MHELSIAMSLVSVATEEADRRGAARVTAVHLKVGPLSGVVADALQSAYALACERSPLAESALVIHATSLTAFCPGCRAARPVRSMQDMCCQTCGAATTEVVTGRELEMTAMEIVS